MADFNQAVQLVLVQEGVLSSDPAGGLTKFGISQNAYPNLTIASLTREDAVMIYRKDFWLFDGLRDQRLANLVFSLSVNMGRSSAIRLLQKATGALQDGKYGPTTESLANNSPDVMVDLGVAAISTYMALDKPEYVKGWVRRVLECYQ